MFIQQTALPLPVGAATIIPGTPVTLQPTGDLLYLVYKHVGGWFGSGGSAKFTAMSTSPFNISIYGPNPGSLGPPWGRMRAPKVNMPDGINNECQGNFTSGTYYLVFRAGSSGPPVAAITANIAVSWWNVF